ncbi:N-acetylmuramoyl-L-alanine amidase [Nitrospinae bacterium AH_259_B05_G02_I21]|nr:N-acetylmuramoyl-L-alanine amidase [Nitrospinae bacterium AH_259_B05_G02_I21]
MNFTESDAGWRPPGLGASMGLVRRVAVGALAATVVFCVATAGGAEKNEGAPRDFRGQEHAPPDLAKLPLVVLDPGHGGPDTGGVGPSGLTEAEVVWVVASELKLLLESERVARVVLTRSSQSNPSLAERTAMANGLGASLFVSLHGGAAFHPGAKGASVYLASEHGRAGHIVLNGSPPELFRPTRRRSKSSKGSPVRWEAVHAPHRAASHRACAAILAAFKNGGALEAHGLHEADLPVLQGSAMPACLVEVATLTHAPEEAALRQPSTRQALVETLFRGVRAALEAGR